MGELVAERANSLASQNPSYASISDSYRTALKVVDDVILKNYISELSKMEIVPPNEKLLESNIRDNVRFFKITEMVYEKDEGAVAKSLKTDD